MDFIYGKQTPQTERTPTLHCTLSAWALLGLYFTGVTSAVSEEEIHLCAGSPLLPPLQSVCETFLKAKTIASDMVTLCLLP